MPFLKIKRRFKIKKSDGTIILETKAANLRVAVQIAVERGVSLSGADLRGANLERADLTAAKLKNTKMDFEQKDIGL